MAAERHGDQRGLQAMFAKCCKVPQQVADSLLRHRGMNGATANPWALPSPGYVRYVNWRDLGQGAAFNGQETW